MGVLCECEAFTESQAKDFFSQIHDANVLENDLIIIGYFGCALFIIWMWYGCYWIGTSKVKTE